MGASLGFFAGIAQETTEDITYEDALRLLSGEKNTASSEQPKNVDMALFWKVWNTIKSDYVAQPVNDDDLLYGAISGMVHGLKDPYSSFFNPELSRQFIGEIEGDFEGIGAEIGIKNEQLTIVAPLPDSPAENAGLRPRDQILAIDGLDTAFMTLNAAVEKIRGKDGTEVTLQIRREGVADAFEVKIVRAAIHVKSVKWEMATVGEKKIAVVTISQFSNDTVALFNEASQQIALEKPVGIIVDVRNNPGGYFDASISVASQFLTEGKTVVFEEESNQTLKPFLATGSASLHDIPTVILINEGSASAAEILAGALQDNDQAVVIGETSYGKGTVQNFGTFDDGSSLKLTIARWLTPSQHQIDKKGIYPDYRVERTDEDYSQDKDPQIDAATLYFTDRAAFDQAHQLYTPPAEEEVTK